MVGGSISPNRGLSTYETTRLHPNAGCASIGCAIGRRAPYCRGGSAPDAPPSDPAGESPYGAPPEPLPLHRRLGLTDDERSSIVELLGRDPTELELAMYAVMWSEHCSYKSSKVHLG